MQDKASNSIPNTRLKLKVVPGASSSGVAGWMGDTLKIRVKAAPEKGNANKETLVVLSETLSVSNKELSLISGHGSPLKILHVSGLSFSEIKDRIAAMLEAKTGS